MIMNGKFFLSMKSYIFKSDIGFERMNGTCKPLNNNALTKPRGKCNYYQTQG